jgi:hypothetical protein
MIPAICLTNEQTVASANMCSNLAHSQNQKSLKTATTAKPRTVTVTTDYGFSVPCSAWLLAALNHFSR